MIVFNYKSKKELKENIGKHLNYIETSIFGARTKDNIIAERSEWNDEDEYQNEQWD